MPLTKALADRVKAFLQPYFDDEQARRTYVQSALMDCPGIDGQILWSGPAKTFTHDLVTLLDEQYGDCNGQPAIVLVIDEVARNKGDDKQATAKQLIDEIRGKGDGLQPGDIICGCTLRRLLGQGGNGSVWLAYDPGTDRQVAIKLLREDRAGDPERVRRFTEEPKNQARVSANNTHVTQVFQVCEHNGLPAIVMQYVPGGSLETHIAKHGPFDGNTACNWLGQIATALDAAHTDPKQPLYHRDVKPENILVRYGDDGQPADLYLTDFGLASSETTNKSRETMPGVKVGTREYIAPEQFASDFYHYGITAATDVYALAIVAYELLTGELPFQGDDDQILAGHRSDPLPPHERLAPFVLAALQTGAAKVPTERPQTASAFVTLLRDAIEGKAPQAVEHYLSVTLPGHIQEVMIAPVYKALLKAFVDPSAELRQLIVEAEQTDDDEPDFELFDFAYDHEPVDNTGLALEMGGEVHPERKVEYSADVEHTDNVRERIKQLKRVVLLGDPGAGKTFTLARLALDYAEAWRTDQQTPLPVFVPLSKYDTAAEFVDFVAARLDGLDISERGVIWLLDALNEMPTDKGQTRHLLAFIEGLIAAGTPFVLTCRVKNYNDLLKNVEGLRRVDLQDLNPRQIHDILNHFLKKYTDTIWEWMVPDGHGQTLLDAWDAWEGGVRAFWHRPETTRVYDGEYNILQPDTDHLRARDALHRDPRKLMLLCRNPFTLVRLLVQRMGMAAQAARGDLERLKAVLPDYIPDNRARLFGEVIQDMLAAEGERENNRWTEADIAAITAALEFTAAALQATQQRTEMPLTDLHAADDAPADLDERLKQGRDAGLVTLTDTAVRFNHQLYQEYFATSKLRALLADYDRRYPSWEDGDPLPPRDERLAELFPDWWEPGGWRVTVALLGELEGATGVSRVVRWLASYSPRIALEILIEENNDGLKVSDLTEAAKQALIAGAHARTDETNPVGRGAAYRVLGHPEVDADDRPGVGVILLPSPRTAVGEGPGVRALPDIVWRPVPAGEYPIGGDSKAYQSLDAQTYTVPEGVQIALYPVTYQQFEAFRQSPAFEDTNNACWADMPEDQRGLKAIGEQRYQYHNHPRERVSWYGAAAFCRWLTEQYHEQKIIDAGYEVVLPDERLWEAAARGKDGKFYPFGGDSHDANKANVYDTRIGMTSAVGIFPAGAADCGALDMSGNVWEWIASKFDAPDETSIDTSNSRRVLRGASFGYGNAVYLRAAARLVNYPDSLINDRGFRVVLVPI